MVQFKKGQGKEETGTPIWEAAAREGIARYIGTAQEKASVWRSWPRKGQEKAPIHTWTGAGRWPLSITSISASS
jgi:hypothetical protein